MQNLQADHIDSNPMNNRAGNLRWVSRKFNNSRKHAKLLKSKNARRTDHDSELLALHDTKTGRTLWFDNGKSAAEALNCSSTSIYVKAGDPNAKLQRRYIVEWIPMRDVPERDLNECMKRSEARREAMREARKNA